MNTEDQQKKGVALLGCTGSIGTQALEVIEAYPDYFDLQVITANNNADLLIEQAKKYHPSTVVIVNEDHFEKVKDALWEDDIHVFAGKDALCQVVEYGEVDVVLTALVGYAGLKPTIKAIEAKKNIALANKETLVVAGELVTKLAREHGVNIYPVDSEHSAIFQCLTGEFHNKIEKIYLTASGGPFRGWSTDQLKDVIPEQALKHPNWEMGAKITIDSATLMNKGLEVIEAKWLFALQPEQIDVIVHPQSIIHSIVQFEDGSMKAQMGLPDMKLPIQDRDTFKNLNLAFRAMDEGGTSACALNAANEVTVQAFLDGKIGFLDIAEINGQTMDGVANIQKPSYEDYVKVDEEARRKANDLVSK